MLWGYQTGLGYTIAVHTTEHSTKVIEQSELQGGISLVEMLFRSNIIGLVGGGSKPAFPPNQFVLWDDLQKKSIGNIDFKTNIKAVRLRRDYIAIVLQTETHVHSFNTLEKVDIIETSSNTNGIISMCSSRNICVIALPEKTTGSVLVKFYSEATPRTSIIKAHKKPISAISLNDEGTLIATASTKVNILQRAQK